MDKTVVKLGGVKRTINYGIYTFWRYDQDHEEGAALGLIGNVMTATIELTFYGLTDPDLMEANELPEDFDKGTVAKWLNDPKTLEECAVHLFESVKEQTAVYNGEKLKKKLQGIIQTVVSEKTPSTGGS